MKAKTWQDTVMSKKEIGKFEHRKTRWDNSGSHFEGICDLEGAVTKQAEVSFKAGMREEKRREEVRRERSHLK